MFSKVSSNVTVSAIITRADGTKEDMGIICGKGIGKIATSEELKEKNKKLECE